MPKFKSLFVPATLATLTLAGQIFASPAFADPPNTVKPDPTTQPNPPVTQPVMPPASPSDINAPNGAVTPGLKVGMTVNDNTGAAIGSVAELKPDASGSGKMFATVKLADNTSFAVDASSLAVDKGVASINLTRDQITNMMKPATPKG
jgi:hypothetical protein